MSDLVDFQPGTHRELQGRRRTEPVVLSASDRLLLDRLEEMFRTLQEASDPQRSTPISGQARYRPAGSEIDEGVSTRWARNVQRKLRARVAGELGEAEARLSDTWSQPEPVPKMRCKNHRCKAANKWIPKYVGPNREVELSRCPLCDKRLYES